MYRLLTNEFLVRYTIKDATPHRAPHGGVFLSDFLGGDRMDATGSGSSVPRGRVRQLYLLYAVTAHHTVVA